MSESKTFDVIIVGAGPAGMFAAYELTEVCRKKKRKLKIAIVEKGKRAEKRKPIETMMGFGGAGTYSDGKLHYTPILSHQKSFHLLSVHRYVELVEYVDKILTKYGVDEPYYPQETKKVNNLVDRAHQHGIKLYVRKIRHVGSDKLERIVTIIQNSFEEAGITIFDRTEVKDLVIKRKKCVGVKLSGNRQLLAGKVLIAPGRVGAKWLQDLCKKYGIDYMYDKVEVGVRVEFPESIMREYSDLMYEAIFEIRTKSFDDVVRTFCPCPNGHVAIEDYKGYVCVNGHTNSGMESPNSNFAFVTEIALTEPVENTTLYAQSIAELVTTLGGGKPIVQRLADLRAGRRSTWNRICKSYVDPTLIDVTPGDIAMGLPYRVTQNILEGLEKLNEIMPGLNSGSTLLYAPEVKYRGSKIKTNTGLQTSIPGLFVAGDGAGVSGNIIGAAVTGVIAARGMI